MSAETPIFRAVILMSVESEESLSYKTLKPYKVKDRVNMSIQKTAKCLEMLEIHLPPRFRKPDKIDL